MKATIDLVLEFVGGIILFFLIGYVLAKLSGYSEYYDKMLYDDVTKPKTKIKQNNEYKR